jgi:carbamoyl-phosphate synthase large subunit
VLGAAVSGMDAADTGFEVRSLQEYALDRQAAL